MGLWCRIDCRSGAGPYPATALAWALLSLAAAALGLVILMAGLAQVFARAPAAGRALGGQELVLQPRHGAGDRRRGGPAQPGALAAEVVEDLSLARRIKQGGHRTIT